MSRKEDEKSLHFTTSQRTTHSLYPRASAGGSWEERPPAGQTTDISGVHCSMHRHLGLNSVTCKERFSLQVVPKQRFFFNINNDSNNVL